MHWKLSRLYILHSFPIFPSQNLPALIIYSYILILDFYTNLDLNKNIANNATEDGSDYDEEVKNIS